jgi:hypothetical protein
MSYGLLAYMGEMHAVADEARLQATAERMAALAASGQGLIPRSLIPEATLPAVGCPECGATCINLVSSGGKRCSNCGHQWDQPGSSNEREIGAWTASRYVLWRFTLSAGAFTRAGGIGHNLPREAPQAFAHAVVDGPEGPPLLL